MQNHPATGSNRMTLIPFGLRAADQRFVDVSEVPKGIACACICPSCHAPLIARQGNVLQWHFAHASRGVGNGDIRQCAYSFYLSVALMAKQMFLECRELTLPDYIHTETRTGPSSHKTYRDAVTLTHGRRITPQSCRVDSRLEGHGIDVVCEIQGVPLGIALVRPDKPCRLHASMFEGKKEGVIQLDLAATLKLFQRMRPGDRQEGFHKALEHYLFKRRDNKQWIYYPRQEQRIAELKTRLQARVEQAEEPHRKEQQRLRELRQERHRLTEREQERIRAQQEQNRPAVPKQPNAMEPPLTSKADLEQMWLGASLNELLPTPKRPKTAPPPAVAVRYQCVLCDITWNGTRQGLNPCPKCGSHLYRRELGEVE